MQREKAFDLMIIGILQSSGSYTLQLFTMMTMIETHGTTASETVEVIQMFLQISLLILLMILLRGWYNKRKLKVCRANVRTVTSWAPWKVRIGEAYLLGLLFCFLACMCRLSKAFSSVDWGLALWYSLRNLFHLLMFQPNKALEQRVF